MHIECPACARSYHVKATDIGESGRRVICQQCNTSWVVRGESRRSLEAVSRDMGTLPAVAAAGVPRPQFSVTTDGPKYRPARWRGLRPTMTFVACMALSMGLIGARERVVRLAPRLADVYETLGMPVNLRGLEFASLAPQRVAAGEVTIGGTIRNVVHRKVDLPRLVYEVRDVDGKPLLSWTEKAPMASLAVGKSLPFQSSPHAVPPAAKTVLVRFAGDADAKPAPGIRAD